MQQSVCTRWRKKFAVSPFQQKVKPMSVSSVSPTSHTHAAHPPSKASAPAVAPKASAPAGTGSVGSAGKLNVHA
jgi:hypothetical protein